MLKNGHTSKKIVPKLSPILDENWSLRLFFSENDTTNTSPSLIESRHPVRVQKKRMSVFQPPVGSSLTPENWGWLIFTFQPSWWSSPTHLKSMLEFGSFPQGSPVTKWKVFWNHPEKLVRLAIAEENHHSPRRHHPCFFLRGFWGEWNLLRTHIYNIYKIAMCGRFFGRSPLDSFLFMISKHDFRGMYVFQLLPKNKQRYLKKNKQTHYAFWITSSANTNKKTTITDHPQK